MIFDIIKEPFFGVSSIAFCAVLCFYVITCFQWFSYKAQRVLFHFTRPLWHLVFVIIPLVLYYTSGNWFFIYFYFAYLPSVILWHKKLDKKLVFTARIKRFFAFFGVAVLSLNLFNYLKFENFSKDMISPIIISLIISHFFEKFMAFKYKKQAKNRLDENKNLQIILITASYGKTSIKNFLFALLKDDFNVHKTPRSVNTLVGIIKDINENISQKTQIYIAEAGARQSGDIAEISTFLNPQIVVVGEIGAQHIEYFKTLENIRATKLEALQTNRLKMAFLHSSTQKNESENIKIYDKNLSDIVATLDGLNFTLDKTPYFSPLLGKFNAFNLACCIEVAKFLGVDDDRIKSRLLGLENVEHRLVKMQANGKIIIDDSFNGNFAGMSQSYELVGQYRGRKVLVTPGIVEASVELNERLSRVIDEIFDVIIITSPLNAQALLKHIKNAQIVILKDKNKMQEILIEHTKTGDLVLFSNDAPSFM